MKKFLSKYLGVLLTGLMLLLTVLVMLLNSFSHAATFTESQVGGDTSGAISVNVQKFYQEGVAKYTIGIAYETRDSGGAVIRSGTVSLDYDTMTTTEKNFINTLIGKAITKVKTTNSIP